MDLQYKLQIPRGVAMDLDYKLRDPWGCVIYSVNPLRRPGDLNFMFFHLSLFHMIIALLYGPLGSNGITSPQPLGFALGLWGGNSITSLGAIE